MNDRIEEVTRKIYNEGVVKAKNDAREIIDEARSKADELIAGAQKQRDNLIRQAQLEIEAMKQKADAEIKLAGKKYLSALKQKITEIITVEQVEVPAKNALNDAAFLREIIKAMVNNWQNGGHDGLNILLPEMKRKELLEFFDSKAFESMNRGIELGFDASFENGFRIIPGDGRYLLSFTDRDFINYFRQYLTERTKRLLFDSKESE